ncbi:MAG: type II toxin-antitoxin system HicB family antitoxin [Candidatus Magasanikbacteria bacterium]|nr:type II toxin-antitoxin system HicB family antitoxin [Candidatus Magasanikbacteria bacterium]
MAQSNKFHYNLIFHPELEGGFTVLVPSLPGCISYGRTLEEARKNIIDAVGGYVESLRKHKEPIPNDEKSFFTSLDFEINYPYAAAA